jgi:glycosyltransferase involved in cell wall biosynthesis
MTTIQAIFYADPDRYPPVINQARLFAEHGYEYDLLCRASSESWNVSYPEQVRLRRVSAPKGKSWREYLHFVWSAITQSPPSAGCIVAHDMHAFLPGWLVARRRRLPLVYQIHEVVDETSPLDGGGRLIYRFHRRFARTADLVIVSDAGRAAILAERLRLRSPVLVVTNSPLKRAMVARGTRLQQALQERGRHFERIVLRQSRIGPSHALEATIRSIPAWASQEWGFVVIGPGREEYLTSLWQLAADLNVQDQFVLLPPVSYDDLFFYTVGADAGHALYEPVDTNNRVSITSSNKLMEYMAVGLPLIVSQRPALEQFIAAYRCGIAVDESSPESIAASINFLLGNPEQASRLGRAGQKAFEQEFCYERQFAFMLDAMSQLGLKRQNP